MLSWLTGLLVGVAGPGLLGLLLAQFWVGFAYIGLAFAVAGLLAMIYGYERERRRIERGE